MFKNALVWLLMLLFALIVMPLTFFLGFYNTFFDQTFYTKDLANFSYTFVTENLPSTNESNELGNISEKDWQQVFKKVFTPEDASDFFAKSFVSVKKDLANVVDGNAVLHFPLDDFKSKKANFTAEVANILYARVPTCADKVKPKAFECMEKGLAKADFSSRVSSIMDITLFSKLPNTFDVELAVPTFLGSDVWGYVYGAFHWVFVIGFSFCLFLLVTVAILVGKPWHKIMKYGAKTILLPSSLLSVFVLGLYFFPSLLKFQPAGVDVNNYLLVNFIGLFFKAFSFNLLIYVIPALILGIAGTLYSLRFANEP
ncbi:MAG: hypothetical protein NTZ25_03760 [Candidatus Peregrinibacteria bacterium]|nr:hypothetical protein [Candidatus Peregrinibacteria bacterium]